MKLTHIGLFEGIGGFSLAARWAEWETLAWCEIDPFCRAVLSYHFPNADALSDIKTTNFTKYAGKIDVLSGGFPCQPYSLSGKRLGKADDRHLWPEMLRAIREIKPRWVVGENVYGIISWNGGMVFNEVQTDLENEGYEVQAYLLPAVGVDAPHQRYRVWFVGFLSEGGVHNKRRNGNDVHGRYGSGKSWTPSFASDSGAQSVRSERENAKHGLDAFTYAMCSQREWKIRRLEPVAFDGGNQSFTDSESTHPDGYPIRKVAQYSFDGDFGSSGSTPNAMFEGFCEHGVSTKPRTARYCAGCNYAIVANPHSSRRIQSNEGTKAEFQLNRRIPDWRGFPTQSPLCRRNDGFPGGLVGVTVPSRKGRRFISERQAKARLRREAIKAYGNAIVPQVAYQIFKSINAYEKSKPTD